MFINLSRKSTYYKLISINKIQIIFMSLKNLIKLIRVRQWYKNLVIFLPIIFSNLLLDPRLLVLTIFAFISLCFISSSNYIINDIVDIKSDRLHPEKKDRSIASGKISITTGIFLSIIFIIFSFAIAFMLPRFFLYSVLGLFVLNFIYSIFLKNEPFLDIIMVAINFVIRAISGVFVINREISPWLILCPFFLALFLLIGKREADIKFLKEDAYKHKEVLRFYSPEITNNLLTISTTLLIISYSLYAFLSGRILLLITLPVAIYVIFRYLYLIYSGSIIPRHPEKMYMDIRLLIGSLLWIFMIILILYFNKFRL